MHDNNKVYFLVPKADYLNNPIAYKQEKHKIAKELNIDVELVIYKYKETGEEILENVVASK
jgi:hypothetical protein